MRKVVLLLASLLMLTSISFAGIGCDDDEAEVTWTIATYTLPGSLPTATLEKFADLVLEKSDGRMEIVVKPGGTLYSTDAEIFQAVSTGEIEGGGCSTSAYSTQMPNTSLIMAQQWSWQSGDMDEYIYIRDALLEGIDICQQECDNNNVMHFMWINPGRVEMYFTFEVDEPGDLAGKVISTSPGGGVYIVQGFGATPKPEEVADLSLSVQSGSIDGRILLPVSDYVDLQLYEDLPYVLITNPILPFYPLLLNTDAWDELDAELKQAVTEAGEEAQEWGFGTTDDAYEEDIAFLENQSGVTVTELTGDARMGFAAVYNGTLMAFLNGAVDAEIVTDVLAVVEQAKLDYAAS